VFLPLQNGSTLDTLYYADDGENNDAAGVFKYSLVGTNWVFNGAMTINDVNPKGFDGLTGALEVSGGATSVVLYATSGGATTGGGGFLYVFTDTAGYNVAPSVRQPSLRPRARTRLSAASRSPRLPFAICRWSRRATI